MLLLHLFKPLCILSQLICDFVVHSLFGCFRPVWESAGGLALCRHCRALPGRLCLSLNARIGLQVLLLNPIPLSLTNNCDQSRQTCLSHIFGASKAPRPSVCCRLLQRNRKERRFSQKSRNAALSAQQQTSRVLSVACRLSHKFRLAILRPPSRRCYRWSLSLRCCRRSRRARFLGMRPLLLRH